MPDKPGLIKPGASGMAQGRIAQLMARAYHRTGDQRFSDAAKGALAVVPRAGEPRRRGERGLGARLPAAAVVRGARLPGGQPVAGRRPQRVHGDGAQPRHERLAPALPPEPARRPGPQPTASRRRAPGAMLAAALSERLARDGEKSLQRYLPLHDTGKWSLYGLLTPGYKWRTHVADVGYHCYHVRLLRLLQDAGPRLRLRRLGGASGTATPGRAACRASATRPRPSRGPSRARRRRPRPAARNAPRASA